MLQICAVLAAAAVLLLVELRQRTAGAAAATALAPARLALEAELRRLPPLLGRLGLGPTWRDAAAQMLF